MRITIRTGYAHPLMTSIGVTIEITSPKVGNPTRIRGAKDSRIRVKYLGTTKSSRFGKGHIERVQGARIQVVKCTSLDPLNPRTLFVN